MPHESTNDQASKQSSQVKPYADTYDLWTEALESLKEEERRDVEALLGDLNRDDTDRKGLVDDIQKKLDVASKSEHHDRTRSIDKFLSVLNKFLSVGDVVVSFDPVHAALPWAAVRSVIVVSRPLVRVCCMWTIRTSDNLFVPTIKLNSLDFDRRPRIKRVYSHWNNRGRFAPRTMRHVPAIIHGSRSRSPPAGRRLG